MLATWLLSGSLSGPAAADKVTLHWTTCCAQVDRHEMFQRWARRFEERNPDIEIEWAYPAGSYGQQITTMLAAGIAPDVFWAGVDFWRWYEMATPMEDLAARNPNLQGIFPLARDLYTWQGELRAAPYGVNTTVYYYNKHHFDEAGLPYPSDDWTWDDMIEMGKQLVRRDGSGTITRYAVQMPSVNAIMTYGAPFFSPDGTRTLINHPATITALQYYADTQSPSLEIHSTFGTTGVSQLIAGQVSMFSDGVHRVPNLRDEMIDDWDVIGHPHIRLGSDMYRSAFVSAEAWVIPTTTQYPDEARRFVEFLLEPEQMAEFTALGGIIPAQASIAQEYFLGSAPKPENMVAFIEAIEYSNLMHNFHPYGPDAWSMIQPLITQVVRGLMPAEAAVPQMAEMVNNMLSQNMGH